jgi:hypothetical protein
MCGDAGAACATFICYTQLRRVRRLVHHQRRLLHGHGTMGRCIEQVQ